MSNDKPIKPSYSVETHVKIWNDKTGCHINVGPDRDGLDLVEIRCITSDGKEERQLVVTPEEARMLAAALIQLYGPLPS